MEKTVKEKEAQKRFWCIVFLVSCLICLLSTVILTLANVPNTIGLFLGCATAIFWVLAMAALGNISETGIAGEFAIFMFWIFSYGNWDKSVYINMFLRGGAVLFFLITLIGWLMRIKDCYRVINVFLAIGVTVFIFLLT